MVKFETIKQAPESADCLPCVLAMATGKDFESIKKDLKMSKMGFGYDWDVAHDFLIDSGIYVDYKYSKLPILHNPSILILPLKLRPDFKHAIFWDGYKVRDPDPQRPEFTDLTDYDVEGMITLPLIYGVP